jgi:hypothetical protein
MRAGRSPQIDGAEGRRSLAAVLAIYEAAGLLDQSTTRPIDQVTNRPTDHPTK